MSDPRMLRRLHDELRQVARELVDGSTGAVVRDDNTTTRHVQPPLLGQLREAVAPTADGGQGNGSGTYTPLNEHVVDVLTQIETDAADLHVKATMHDGFTAEDRIRAMVEIAGRWTNVDHVGAMLNYLREWSREIRDVLEPPKRFDLVAPCPACGVRFVWRQHDGESVKQPALSVDGRTGCTCLDCGHVWPPAQLTHLAMAIGCESITGSPSAG